jgi:alpha-mannosidase
VVDVPPYAFRPLDEALVEEDRQVTIRVAEPKQDGYILENELVEVWINPHGQITRFYEKNSQREIIQPGVFGNQLVLYEDKPFAYEAWNVDVYYLEKQPSPGSNFTCQIEKSGPLRVSLRVEQDLGQDSRLVQTISLDAISPRLDFETWVDWQEDQQFLRVLFPLDLRSDFATYEVQYGNVKRPTHFNTPYDLARFEVPAQRWADLSEPDFGVALINDCRYGYACHGNVLSLSLLRAPNNPDPLADRGRHHFRYALYPHALSPQLSAVWAEAAAFNQKIQYYPGHTKRFTGSFFQVDAPNIVLDTVKMAEDGDGIILRLYESSGSHTHARIKTGFPMDIVWQCDLLERNKTALKKVEPNGFSYHFSPFEILNVQITGN